MESDTARDRKARFGIFEFDLKNRTLYGKGIDTGLGAQPARLLDLLIDRLNQVVTRVEICNTVWPGEKTPDFHIRINHAINCIRHALHDDRRNPVYIETISKRGYKFMLPQPNQTIVIRGHGLGSYTNFTALDSPYLAIRDKTARWAAGRIMQRNFDDVTLSVSSWKDSEIIVTGFHGFYGKHGWKLNPGDKIEIAIWNPQTGGGPVRYHLSVVSETAER